jgi:hypothetical protein
LNEGKLISAVSLIIEKSSKQGQATPINLPPGDAKKCHVVKRGLFVDILLVCQLSHDSPNESRMKARPRRTLEKRNYLQIETMVV